MNIKFVLLWSFVTLVILFLAAIGAIKLFVSPARVEAIVIPHLRQLFNREVQVGSTELMILGGVGARIHNVTIKNVPPFDAHPLATIGAIDATLQLVPLLWGSLRLKQLTLDGWEIYLTKDSSGATNYDSLTFSTARTEREKSASSEPFVDDLDFRDGRLLYRNDSTNVRMVLGSINLHSELGDGEQADFEGDLRVDSVFIWSSWGDFLIYPAAIETKLTGSYFHVSDSLAIEECNWSIDKIRGRLEGAIAGLTKSPQANLRLLSERNDLLDFYDSKIISAFPVLRDAKLDGELRIDITYQGRIADKRATNIRGKINITDASARFPESDVDFKMKLIECNFSEQSLSVFTEQAAIGTTPALFRLAIDNYADPTISGELKIACDAGLLGPIVGLDKQKKLVGKIDASLSGFVRPTEKEQARLFGALVLEGISYSNPALTWGLDTINAICNFAGSNAELARLDLVAGGNKLQLSGKIVDFAPYIAAQRRPHKRPLFNFVCVADSFNFDTLATKDSRNIGTGDTSLVMHALDYLFDFDANGLLQIGHGTFAGVEFDDLKSNVTVVNRIIYSDSVVCHLFGGNCVSDVVIDLNNLLDPEFEIDCAARSFQANDLLSCFTQFEDHLTGSLDLQATFKGRGLSAAQIVPTLTANGKATMRDGQITDFALFDTFRDRFAIEAVPRNEFQDLQAAFKIADRTFLFSPLSLKSGKTVCQIDGSVSFDGSLDCRFNRVLSKDDARTLSGLPDARDRFKNRSAAKAVFRLIGGADSVAITLESIQTKD